MNKNERINNTEVAVLGGGLAGLSAAYELMKAGKKVIVIEKESDVGGLARTIRVGDFSFDTGPHRWYTKSNMVNNWMSSLLGKRIIRIPRLTRIYFDKKFFYYPIKIGNAMSGIGIYKAFRSLIDYFIARTQFRLTKKQPRTLEEGYINQFGRTLYEIFFKRYSEKLWGRKCTQISADWIGQRSRGFNIMTILKDTFFRSRKVVSFVDEFSYPKKGIGQLAWTLADGIKKSGGEILLESEVSKIKHDKSKIVSVIINNKGTKKEIKARQFISSIAISDFISFLFPVASSSVLKVNKKLKYRDEVQVALFINKEKITPDTWIYVHPFELPYVRIMEMDNWSPQFSPKGKTTLVFEIVCNKGDNVWKKSDRELIDEVSESYLKEFNLIKKDDILGGFVHRVAKEYPVYHLNYKEDVAFLKNFLKRFDNLQLVGRNGIFRYNNMDHSIEMGLYAAWNVISGERKFDIESVNIEREYLEEKRIEIPEDEKVEREK